MKERVNEYIIEWKDRSIELDQIIPPSHVISQLFPPIVSAQLKSCKQIIPLNKLTFEEEMLTCNESPLGKINIQQV